MKREALSRHVAALLLNAFERGGGNAVATSQIATAIMEKLRALVPGCDRCVRAAFEALCWVMVSCICVVGLLKRAASNSPSATAACSMSFGLLN